MHQVKFKVSEQACVDILTTAHDQGSMYWLADYEPSTKRAEDLGIKEISVSRFDGDGESTERIVHNRITAASIATAIGALIDGRQVHNAIIGEIVGNLDQDGCGADAEACDCVLQMAMFGKVVYG